MSRIVIIEITLHELLQYLCLRLKGLFYIEIIIPPYFYVKESDSLRTFMTH